jgi:hypothetical protein
LFHPVSYHPNSYPIFNPMTPRSRMVSIETISIVFTGLSVSLAAFYYISTLRNAQRTQQLQLETRQAQLFMQIYQQFISKDFKLSYLDIINNWSWDDFDDFIRKYVADIENNSKWDIVGSFFEGIGVLVKRGLVNPALVDDLMSGHTLMSWEKMEPVYLEIRRRWNWPQIAEWWEYLYNEIKAIASEQHPELLDRRISILE